MAKITYIEHDGTEHAVDVKNGLSVMARALPAIRSIVKRHPNGVVAVVSHKATIRLVLSSLLGIDPRGYRDRLDQAPACLNVVVICALRSAFPFEKVASKARTEAIRPARRSSRSQSMKWSRARLDLPSAWAGSQDRPCKRAARAAAPPSEAR